MRFISLVIALLLMALFAPAAGAIYIPGQEIPNDGMYHILAAETGAAETGAAETGAVAPAQKTTGISMPGLMPSTAGISGLFSQGFPAQIAGSVPPVMPGAISRTIPMPSVSLPPADAEGNIIIGDTIGHIASPPTPGYWDNLQGMDLHTNMPVINVPAIIGL